MSEDEKKERLAKFERLRVLVMEICGDLRERGDQEKSDSLSFLTGFTIGAALKAEQDDG